MGPSQGAFPTVLPGVGKKIIGSSVSDPTQKGQEKFISEPPGFSSTCVKVFRAGASLDLNKFVMTSQNCSAVDLSSVKSLCRCRLVWFCSLA